MCPATVWIISGLRRRPKNVTALAPQLFMNMAPALELLVFMSVALALELFFHGSGSSFCSFSHIHILIVLVCLKLNGK